VKSAAIPHPLQNIYQRRETIARQWYTAIVPVGGLFLTRAEALKRFLQLTDQVIAFLLLETPEATAAREIGANLASLHCITPVVMEVTGELWSRQLVEGLSPEEDHWSYPRLVALLNGMSTGFAARAREIVLREQEEIRLAMASDLLHKTEELKKYQSQLESMLEERTQELRESEERFRAIAETSLDGIYQSTDDRGTLVFVNDAFARMLGYTKEELLGRTTLSLISEEDLPKLGPIAENVRINKPASGEFRLKHKDGHLIDIQFSVVPTTLKGQIVRSGILQDISERKRAEAALRESEQRYRTLAEAAQDLIFIVGRENRIEYVNSFAAKRIGVQPAEIIGQPRERFFSTADNRRMRNSLEQVLKKGEAKYSENKVLFPEGPRWLSTWLVPLRDSANEVTSVLEVSRDISERKLAEEALQRAKDDLEKHVAERTARLTASQEQLRKLTQQLVTAQEEERRRVSRELHDEAGQALITLKYSLDSILDELPEQNTQIRQRLLDAIALIDQTNDHIRNLSHSLRPPVLDIAGINLSLKEFCREFAERTKLPVHYRGEEVPDLPDAVGISLYRFVQEAFTNILKHAQASQVRVGLRYRKGEIVLSVDDNGCRLHNHNGNGMSHHVPTSHQMGIGLLGIEERLNLLGGHMEIHSKPGQGSRITAYIPWHEK